MTPTTILNKLEDLRRRERKVRLIWGAARVAAAALLLLAFCCLVDWLIDRWYDTPFALRQLFLVSQWIVAAVLAVVFIVLPMLKPLSNSLMARWVESAFPDFRHRLVTAVELNRSGANTEGMSPSLITVVTQEAEQKAAATDFGPAVDARRLKWSSYVFFPVVVLVLLPAIIAPRTVGELLGRQLLRPIEITRSVRFKLHDVTSQPPDNLVNRDDPRPPHDDIDAPAVCAGGDLVAVRFQAEGNVSQSTRGTLRILPEDGPSEDVPLEWERETPEGKAVFVAKVPPSSTAFRYKAWLGDARMRQVGQVEFRGRPTVESQQAVVLLPEYCGLRSDGTRFEEAQAKGDVVALSSSSANVKITASKQLKRAVLEVLGPAQPGAPESVLSTAEMKSDESGKGASSQFNLDVRQTAYRILVWDELGFANRVIPRRGVTLLPNEPPIVTLLPERFAGLSEDNEADGLPIVLGGGIRIAYRAKSIAGLSKQGETRYRINESGDFLSFPLRDTDASSDVGPFELERGVFKNIRDDDNTAQIEFHRVLVPEEERDLVPSRREGGGRFDFQIPKELARENLLRLGDKIEFYVEVLDTRSPQLVGRSEVRIKEVVNSTQLLSWLQQKRQESERLRDLEKRQGVVFDPLLPKVPD